MKSLPSEVNTLRLMQLDLPLNRLSQENNKMFILQVRITEKINRSSLHKLANRLLLSWTIAMLK